MAGLKGAAGNGNVGTTYLSIVNGKIWDKTVKDSNHPFYKTETFVKPDETEGTREGAAYLELSGTIISVLACREQKFGDYLEVEIDAGEEKTYTISAKRNARTSQDLMKFLLMGDLSKEVVIKPYDFTNKDTGKRVNGTNFFQDGKKVMTRDFVGDGMPVQEEDFWKNAASRKIKKYFYDLDEWLGDEITERIEPLLVEVKKEFLAKRKVETEAPKEVEAEAPKEEVKRPSVIAMKKVIKAYIAENYEGKTIPKLTKDEVPTWYDLAVAEDELPFENEVEDAEVSEDSITDELNDLL